MPRPVFRQVYVDAADIDALADSVKRNNDILEQEVRKIGNPINTDLLEPVLTAETVLKVNRVYRVDATEASFTAYLPKATDNAEAWIRLYKIASGGTVTIEPQAGETVRGTTSVSLSSVGASHLYIADAERGDWLRI